MSNKKIYNLFLYRDTYTLKSTVGKLYFENEFFCHTLEDVVRGRNIKIKNETAIPEGIYDVILTYSGRFKRTTPQIVNQPGGKLVKDGISFIGIRMHGGNTHKNTSGCPLCAYNRLNDDTIQGTAEKDLTAMLQNLVAQGYEIKLYVINMPQLA